MQVRDATVEDVEIVLRHRRAMFTDMGHGSEAERDAMITAARPIVARGLGDGSYRGWFVESDGQVIAGGGVAIVPFQPSPLDPVARRAWVLNMYTEPDYRRRGLARLLMNHIISWCRAEGFRTLQLHASDDGKALYEALGFRPTNEMRLKLVE